jgi:hypothetical protein
MGDEIDAGRDDMNLNTSKIHVRRITGFITKLSGSNVSEEGAPTPTPQREGHMDMCDDHVDYMSSPFHNNTIGEFFGVLERSQSQAIGGCAHNGTVVRRRASTSLLSEGLERASSRLRMEEKSNFETQMSKLKCLSIRKEVEMVDATGDCEGSRTGSWRGMAGELRVQIQKSQMKAHGKPSPSTAGSSGSEAMPIPHISRACTAPDQLPELSSSMLESLLLEREKEEKKNKSPKGVTLSTPNGQERMHATRRRVPSAAFLDDLAALQERQYSVFRNDSDKRISTRHHLYST